MWARIGHTYPCFCLPKQSPAYPCPATMTQTHEPCQRIVVLEEKVANLEAWRRVTEADIKEIRDVISQVKLLITLSIGGGGLSIITLIVTVVRLFAGD